MKIGVIGGNGKTGQLIINEALNRGHEVIAFVRKENIDLRGARVITKDLFNLNYDDIENCDTIINAFGLWEPETMPQYIEAAKHLSNILGSKENRLLVIGSAGSLYVDPEHTKMFIETPEMPEFAMPVAKAQAEALAYLRTRDDVKWTYISPPIDFRVDGARTGVYKLGKEELILSDKGESQISYSDFAIAVVDEAENAKFVKQRFTVVAV